MGDVSGAGDRVLEGRLATPGGLRVGRLRFGERIEAVDVGRVAHEGDAGLPLVAPGFIDQHVHGGGGGDAMDGEDGVRALARHHLRYGTTTLFPTTLTAPWPRVLAALRGIAEVASAPAADEAAVLGAHLEGPFVNPKRLGAQPPHAIDASPERVDEVLAARIVRLATVAPELPGVRSSAARLAAAGVRLNVGHTRADAATVEAFLADVRAAGGHGGATHLFNAMGGLDGRAPGPVGALLGDGEAAIELICDGHHVAAAAVRTAWRAARERLVLITDAIRASGLRDGATELGGAPVTVVDGAARLADGTLAGSVLTMDAAVRGAVAAGIDLADALHAASAGPARYLGLADRGALAPGLRADLVVLSPNLGVRQVWCGGVLVHEAQG